MIKIDTDNQITLDAMETWGEGQIPILQEECAECISALARFLRGRTDSGPVAEEIADVIVSMMSVIPLLGVEDEVKKQMERKLNRLQNRMRGIQWEHLK